MILRDHMVSVYIDSLKLVWQVSILFPGISFLLVFIEKQISLRTELDTEYGLEKEEKKKQPPSALDDGTNEQAVTAP